MRGLRITGWGGALPDTVVTNAELEKTLDTTDAWITERTGIRERRVGGTTTGLATDAGRAALERAGVDPATVGLVVVATCTPDQAMPASAATVQAALGVHGGAMDLNAVCAGFVYGLVTAAGLAAAGVDRILLVGADTMSTIVDWDDRATAILFADGAGAVVVEATDGPGDLLAFDLDNDGSARHLLQADVGGCIRMDGHEVFRRAVRATVDSAQRTLQAARCSPADVALFVPHQANVRIIDAVCSRLDIPREHAVVTLDRHGNTSAASVPLALAEAVDQGRVQPGDLVLLAGFGAGMSVASALIRWSAPTGPVSPSHPPAPAGADPAEEPS